MSEASEELLINVNPFETRVALLSQGALLELHVDRARAHRCTGNIYLGSVERLLPGMQAAFVDIGLPRPGFLHARAIGPRISNDGEAAPKPDIRTLVHEGQRVLVQATKDPIAHKGVRLTTELSIAANHVVMMPLGRQIGVSRRIADEQERERLRDFIAEARAELGVEAGVIARTAGEGAAYATIKADIEQLARLWDYIRDQQSGADGHALVYEEPPLHLRVLRELCRPRLKRILIDDEECRRRTEAFAAKHLPEILDRIEIYDGPRPLFEGFGIEEDIARALQPRVALKCGGFLVIEQTEAMTTIDVNTGSFLGGSRFEETIYRTNLEAASVIPRQLRLRNIGGIIVVDFIDMEDAEHQRQVLRTLESASLGDRARFAFDGFSSLGLVQISRKRTRGSLLQQLCEPCPLCAGVGLTQTSETTCIDIFRAILRDARCQRPHPEASYLIRASEAVVDRLLDEDADLLAALASQVGLQMRLQVEPSYGPGAFDLVLAQDAAR